MSGHDHLPEETVAKFKVQQSLHLDRASLSVSPLYNLLDVRIGDQTAMFDMQEATELRDWLSKVLP